MGIREYAVLWYPDTYTVRSKNGCTVRCLDGSIKRLKPGDKVSVAYIRNGSAHVTKPFKGKVPERRLQPEPNSFTYHHDDQSTEKNTMFQSLEFLEREKFDHILVDLPNLIHKWMRELSVDMRITTEMEEEMVQALVEKLEVLFKIPTESTRCLYIAADGVQAKAKYRAGLSRIPYQKHKYKRLEEKTFKDIFDWGVYIPGSSFTKKLESAIVKMLRQWRKPCEVYFDPSTSSGEAEHKITKCIRCLPDNSRVLIISGDSDFYTLCAVDALRLHIWIYKPQKEYGSRFNLEEQVKPLLNSEIQSPTDSTIHDYLVLSSLLGNDFNKPVLGFSTIGRDIIFKCYRRCVLLGRTPLASEHGIDFDNLAHFLRILLNWLNPEDPDIGFAEILFDHLEHHLREDFIQAASECHYGQVSNDVEEFLEEFSNGDVDVQRIYDRFHEKVGETFGEGFAFDKFCTAYLASLQFSYRLQINGKPTGDVSYEYSSAPLLPRLVEFMEQRMDLQKIEEILRRKSTHSVTPLDRMIVGKTEDQIKYMFKNEEKAAEIFDCIVHGKLSRFYSEEAEAFAVYLGETIPFKGFIACNKESVSMKEVQDIVNEVKLLLNGRSRKALCGKSKDEVWKFSTRSAQKKVKTVIVHRTLMKMKPTPFRAKLKFWNHGKGFGRIDCRGESGRLFHKNIRFWHLEKNFRNTQKLGEGAVIEFFVLRQGSVRVVCTDFVVEKKARKPRFYKTSDNSRAPRFYKTSDNSRSTIKSTLPNDRFYAKYSGYLDDFTFN